MLEMPARSTTQQSSTPAQPTKNTTAQSTMSTPSQSAMSTKRRLTFSQGPSRPQVLPSTSNHVPFLERRLGKHLQKCFMDNSKTILFFVPAICFRIIHPRWLFLIIQIFVEIFH